MKKALIAVVALSMFTAQGAYAMDSYDREVKEELAVYVTNKSKRTVYIQFFVGPTWETAYTKDGGAFVGETVNALAGRVTCYAKMGNDGFSANQGNLMTVNVYGDSSFAKSSLLGRASAKAYLYSDKDITIDKGNFWNISIGPDFSVDLRHVQVYTGRD